MSNVLKFQSPYEKAIQSSNIPEVSLNRAVLLQLITDATNTSPTREAKKHEIEAKNWIFTDSDDLSYACDAAGLHPKNLRNIALEAIKLKQEQTNTSNSNIKIGRFIYSEINKSRQCLILDDEPKKRHCEER